TLFESERHQPLIAAVQQLFGGHAVELFELGQQLGLDAGGSFRHIAVSTTQRLGDQVVDQTQLLQARRGHAHGLGGVGGLFGTLPQDGGAAFGGNHRVDGVLQHHQTVADTDCQRTTGTTLTDYSGDDRRLQTRHYLKVPGNRLALTALFSVDTRIGTGRVDKGDDRHVEALGHLHQTAGLAVALWLGHAEVAAHLLLHVAALLMADDHDRTAVQPGDASDNGSVVGKVTVAVQLFEVGEDVLDVVQRVGTLGVTRHLGHLPARQIGENAFGKSLALGLQAGDLFGDVQRVVAANQPQLFNLGLQIGDR